MTTPTDLPHTLRWRGIPGRVVGQLRGWADTRGAGPATLAWGVVQSSVLPGPVDAVFLPLALARPTRAVGLAAWAVVGSSIGGVIAFGIGRLAPTETLLGWLNVDATSLDRAGHWLTTYGAWMGFAAAVLPISTKAVCLAAGLFAVPAVPFLPAVVFGRLVRFFIPAVVIRWGGERALRRLGLVSEAS